MHIFTYGKVFRYFNSYGFSDEYTDRDTDGLVLTQTDVVTHSDKLQDFTK